MSLVAVALLLPWFALLLLLAPRPLARLRPLLLVAAPLPLLVLFAADGAELIAPRLLFGAGFVVDGINRPLLLLAGAGWAIAGLYAAGTVGEAPRRFALFWLLTLAGQALALLAADIAGFYSGYALMTPAAWGLVVHDGSDAARRAGRVYLVLSLLGEMLLLSGLLLLAAQLGNVDFATLALLPPATLGVAPWLMLAGLAVKLGIVPLHVWLPLAHPVAPVAASAVLSGLLVKAGLLGMLRLLPPDSLAAAPWLLTIGLVTAAWGVVVGLAQTRLKPVLAYSTISQMGLLLAGFAALQASFGNTIALAAVLLFALHHGLNKAALFLAAGHRLRGAFAHALFLLPALAIAGAPLTAGALAKDALKHAFKAAELSPWLPALSVASVATTLLLLHAWRLAAQATGGRERVHPAWPLAVTAGVVLPWWWAPAWPESAALLHALWPLALGVLLHLGWSRAGSRWRLPALPEGDIVRPLERAALAAWRALLGVAGRWQQWKAPTGDWQPWLRPVARLERTLARLPLTGAGLLLVTIALWASLLAAR